MKTILGAHANYHMNGALNHNSFMIFLSSNLLFMCIVHIGILYNSEVSTASQCEGREGGMTLIRLPSSMNRKALEARDFGAPQDEGPWKTLKAT